MNNEINTNERIIPGDFEESCQPFWICKEPIAVDSFKCRIPVEKVSIINPSLKGRWIMVNEDTGEIDTTKTRNNTMTIESEDKTRVNYRIETMPTNFTTEGVPIMNDFISITIPSKLLGKDYFQGITKQTISDIYEKLNSHKVVSFSKDVFLHESNCTDIDLKKDFMYAGNFEAEIREIRKYVRASNQKEKGCRIFTRKDNQGIEFSHRQTTSIASNPYLKIYHKGIELANNSFAFSSKHLADIDYSNVVRMETTIKNKKHYRRLWGHDLTNIHYLTNMPQEDKEEAFLHAINCHFGAIQRKTKKLNPDLLRGKDRIIYEFIKLEMDNGGIWEEVLDTVLQGFYNRSAKSQHKKKLETIYRVYLGAKNSQFPILTNLVTWSDAKIA